MERNFGRIFLVLLLFTFSAKADVPYNGWWQQANRLYQQKNYDSAAVLYEKIASLKTENAEVYFNLGNAYYKLNKIGPAVLNYERALRYRPGYSEASDNLELTQSRISNRIRSSQDIFFVAWWKALTRAQLASVWAITSLILFLFALSYFVARKWGKTPSWLQPQIALLTLAVCVCTIVFAYISARRQVVHNTAVVMEQNAAFRKDLKSTQSLLLVPEGTVLKIESEISGWSQVKLPDGRTGWIRADALQRI